MKHMLSILEIYNQLVKMHFKWIVPSKINILSFNRPLVVSLRIWIVSKESCFLSKKKGRQWKMFGYQHSLERHEDYLWLEKFHSWMNYSNSKYTKLKYSLKYFSIATPYLAQFCVMYMVQLFHVESGLVSLW